MNNILLFSIEMHGFRSQTGICLNDGEPDALLLYNRAGTGVRLRLVGGSDDVFAICFRAGFKIAGNQL